jgi:hypothetical protein
LASRVDAFYLAFKGAARPEAKSYLNERLADGKARKTEVAVELHTVGGTVHGALSTRSRDGWWLIHNDWLSITLEEHASHGWAVVVQPSALLLMHEGPRAALMLARGAARALLVAILDERVRRLDLAADVVNFDLRGIDPRAFAIHHRTGCTDIATLKQYWKRGMRTGFVLGKGDALVRLYDKTEHLRLGLDDVKADDERDIWRFGGWNGTDDVTRVEFQFRGNLLKELDLRNPDACIEKLDSVWAYGIAKWVRIIEIGSATRRDRCRTDARWLALDGVVFRERTAPAKRNRASAVPSARRMVSAVVNFCACMGVIASYDTADVANWSNARAEAWIQGQLFAMAKQTARAAAVDMCGRFESNRDAAIHLMEKLAAAKMRHAPLDLGTLADEAAA